MELLYLSIFHFQSALEESLYLHELLLKLFNICESNCYQEVMVLQIFAKFFNVILKVRYGNCNWVIILVVTMLVSLLQLEDQLIAIASVVTKLVS
jgi:hypothetical protein